MSGLHNLRYTQNLHNPSRLGHPSHPLNSRLPDILIPSVLYRITFSVIQDGKILEIDKNMTHSIEEARDWNDCSQPNGLSRLLYL
jgi:hypothetical protein